MFEELKKIIVQYVDVEPDDIKEDSRLIEDLGFNSYDFMSLLGELEETYDVTIDENDVLNIHTVKEVMDYISSLQG